MFVWINDKMNRIIFMLLICLFVSGCASMLSESSYPVSFESKPNRATVTVTDETGKEVFKGVTPATIRLIAGTAYFHGKDYNVKFEKEGYHTKFIPVIRKKDREYYVNFWVPGGLWGLLIIDPLTGAMWELESPVKAILDKDLPPLSNNQ